MDALSPEEELAVRALVARYHDAVSVFDVPTWAATWATDAEWHVGERSWSGRDAIAAAWEQIRGRYGPNQLHLLGQGTVWAVPGGAEGRWTFLEIGRKAVEGEIISSASPERSHEVDHVEFGCYLDRYKKEDGRWVFAERSFHWPYRQSSIPQGLFSPLPPIT